MYISFTPSYISSRFAMSVTQICILMALALSP